MVPPVAERGLRLLPNNDPSAGGAFVDKFFQQIYASPLWQANKLAVLVSFSDTNGMFRPRAALRGRSVRAHSHTLCRQCARLSPLYSMHCARQPHSHCLLLPLLSAASGPGLRIPTFMVSPYHQRSLGGQSSVNSQPYETYSWFKMLARRFGISNSSLQTMWGQARYLSSMDLTTSFPQGTSNPSSGASVAYAPAMQVAVAAILAVTALLLWQ